MPKEDIFMKTKIALILPAYNEEISIREVIKAFHHELPDAYFCIIDNNSKDRTGEIARTTIAELGCQGIVLFEPRQGKSKAVQKAFEEINADYYIMVDADMTYPAKEVHHLLKPVVENKADMVVGDRHLTGGYRKENKRPFHNIGNIFIRRLINLLFKNNLNDILTGYRVFTRKFVKNFPILGEGFTLETELTLHALDKGFRILEIPIEYKDRPIGSHSKLNTYVDGLRVIKLIVEIFKNFKPLTFFGFISLLFFVGGIIAGLPVLIEFVETQYIVHVPLAILATGLMILAMNSLAIGFILDTVVKNHKFMYGLKLLEYSQKYDHKFSQDFYTVSAEVYKKGEQEKISYN